MRTTHTANPTSTPAHIFIPFLCIICSFLYFHKISQAATVYDSKLDWQTLETKHFYIHFHQGLSALAQTVTHMSPSVYQEITHFFNWQPRQKTHVILVDRIDIANGAASHLPNNVMVLHATPPNDISGLEDFDNWLAIVFRHEFTHIVHLDKAQGLPLFLRSGLGRLPLLFPNTFEPPWIIEGIATFIETNSTTGIGRGQSNYFRGLMRNEVRHGIKSLRAVNQPMLSWPSGTTRYLYGVYFFQFLRDTYSTHKIKQFIDEYSHFPIPFFLNTNSRHVFSKDFYELWQAFHIYLKNQFDPEIQEIHKQGIRAGKKITDSGFNSGFSRSDAEGNSYFITTDRIHQTSLKKYSPAQQSQTMISEVFGQYFDLHKHSGIIFSQYDIEQSVNRFANLYHIDTHSGQTTQLSHTGRYIQASWGPQGNNIAAIQNASGKHALVLLEKNGERQETLWQGDANTIIGSIDWSPKAAIIIASVWRPTLGWNLEIFDLSSKRWSPLTQNRFIEGQPQFSSDGDSIVFTADYNGRYNIYRYFFSEQRTFQLTNVMGGAFYPSLSPQNTLYYADLDQTGFNLYEMAAIEQVAVDIPTTTPPTSPPTNNEPPPQTNTISLAPYLALNHIMPTYWFPTYRSDNSKSLWGMVTSGADPLARHSYELAIAYDSDNRLFESEARYMYDALRPTIFFSFERINTPTPFIFDRNTVVVRTDRLSVNSIFRFNEKNHQKGLFLGAQHERAYLVSPNELSGEASSEKNTVGVGGFAQNTSLKILTVAPANGLRINTTIEQSRRSASNTTGTTITTRLQAFSPIIGKNNVLSGQVILGHGTQHATPFQLGGNASSLLTPLSFAIGKRSFPLHGYPVNAFIGRNIDYAAVAWHLPLARLETGIMAPPIGITKLNGKLYAEAGRAWDDSNTGKDWSRSLGFEIIGNITLGYRFPIIINLGIAAGLDQLGEKTSYLSVGAPF